MTAVVEQTGFDESKQKEDAVAAARDRFDQLVHSQVNGEDLRPVSCEIESITAILGVSKSAIDDAANLHREARRLNLQAELEPKLIADAADNEAAMKQAEQDFATAQDAFAKRRDELTLQAKEIESKRQDSVAARHELQRMMSEHSIARIL